MSNETLNEQSRAAQFVERHVYAPDDYNAYCHEVFREWDEQPEDQRPSGFWIRTNGDSYTEFAAHITYFTPGNKGFWNSAEIDISSDGGRPEIQVWVPSPDGTGEPIVATAEPYNLEALERAIALAESRTQ